MAWFFSNSNNPDIVLTSRIRLARNISGIPFVQRMNKEESERVIKEVSSAIIESNSAYPMNISY
nr:hypothetical protein [Fervidicella metallireducens]